MMGRVVRFRYRNTGFMRQVFIWFKYRGKWHYKGIEFNRHYFRIYRLTDEGTLPRFRDVYGATRKQRKPTQPRKVNKEKP